MNKTPDNENEVKAAPIARQFINDLFEAGWITRTDYGHKKIVEVFYKWFMPIASSESKEARHSPQVEGEKPTQFIGGMEYEIERLNAERNTWRDIAQKNISEVAHLKEWNKTLKVENLDLKQELDLSIKLREGVEKEVERWKSLDKEAMDIVHNDSKMISDYLRKIFALEAENKQLTDKLERYKDDLRFIADNGGKRVEGVSCNGSWCAEQANQALSQPIEPTVAESAKVTTTQDPSLLTAEYVTELPEGCPPFDVIKANLINAQGRKIELSMTPDEAMLLANNLIGASLEALFEDKNFHERFIASREKWSAMANEGKKEL